MDRGYVKRALQLAVEGAGGVEPLAGRWNMSAETIRLVLRGARAPGPAVLTALGLRRVERYEVAG